MESAGSESKDTASHGETMRVAPFVLRTCVRSDAMRIQLPWSTDDSALVVMYLHIIKSEHVTMYTMAIKTRPLAYVLVVLSRWNDQDSAHSRAVGGRR